ncbi:tRNA-queuosine alpha-mannosyltransferase domain-containing protein [Gilvimarinus sp. 1_MG-2023]|uniref:tRNA-queuosine alpha-mannosyltransferase domain-containing protein n=1 Tax=Gilvimarinus sp. 1_MG-2023 TaxID=3062638 RepID=UPI0026E36325|nr:DUF3524 domain-containing protein [Gilvimarinus sp. 1_MG-2023]MDO6746001.1 DUF3524 domain-containing protein [Gilvimarinus sp. 1_MG-2023]
MRVLLLSGYDAASHKRWRQALAEYLPECEFTQLALAPRFFSWRIRGSSLTFASLKTAALDAEYDLLICTSMVDLSSLRGMVPKLAKLPTILYCHENQFDYPTNHQQHSSIEPQIVTLYSSICADRVVFNSEFNRQGFLAGAHKLLKKLPDGVDLTLVESVRAKSQVLPVPLENNLFNQCVKSKKTALSMPAKIVWNHRWEYDKNPELLYRALQHLLSDNNPHPAFQLHLIGQQFRQKPAVFDKIKLLLESYHCLGELGYIESHKQYMNILQQSDIVLSTADHDFQGLSVLEAVALGCSPLLPRHQVYPEMLGEDFCYPVTGNLERDSQTLADQLRARLNEYVSGRLADAPDLSHLSWGYLAQEYRQLLTGTIEQFYT